MTDKEQHPKEADRNRAIRTQEAMQLYASKNPIIQSYVRTEIDTDVNKRRETNQAHHTFTHLMVAHLKELDFVFNHNRFRFKTESTSVNTETFMYLLDIFFEWIDKTEKHSTINTDRNPEAQTEPSQDTVKPSSPI